MIGLLIPGLNIINGGPITNNMVVLDVVNPKNINNIGLFLHEIIPEEYGAAIYFSCPPFEDLQFLGCVANQRSSDIFYTGWSMDSNVNCHNIIKICVKLEELKNIKDAFEIKIKNDNNQEFAKRLAKNLFNYLDSYNKNKDPNNGLLVVPLTSIQEWYDKFLKRYSIDPNFIFKSND